MPLLSARMPHVRAPSVSTFLRIHHDRVVRVVRFGVLGTRARTCMYSTLAWPVPRSSHVPLDSSLYTLTRCIACASTCAFVDEAQHEEWRTCTCVAVFSSHRFASIEIFLPVIAMERGKISIKLKEISMGAGTERTRWETGRDVDETGERSRWEVVEISMGRPGRPSRSTPSNGCRVAQLSRAMLAGRASARVMRVNRIAKVRCTCEGNKENGRG